MTTIRRSPGRGDEYDGLDDNAFPTAPSLDSVRPAIANILWNAYAKAYLTLHGVRPPLLEARPLTRAQRRRQAQRQRERQAARVHGGAPPPSDDSSGGSDDGALLPSDGGGGGGDAS
ncbi:hypothetical protein N7495_002353 [Penicillium taxi]|uniref:uncharacterized protein n=1 Tax=Penicillium taxi TaxID=168475 RepID=UPI002545B1EF|nr:uncharacterized protein N7495_002353 [Penicillium taxi]KAJ5901825.1 hypothetical protein N7495_002353 [Penicillium taxi]